MSQPSGVPVPGKSGSAIFLRPFMEAFKLLTAQGKYMDKKLKKHGARVFRAHPGLPTIILADNTAVEFFYKAPDDLVEREPIQRFGFVGVQQKLNHHSDTVILSSGDLHKRSRAFFEAVLSSRQDHMRPNFEKYVLGGIKQWPTLGDVPIETGFQRITAPFFFQWLTGSTPDADDVLLWQKHIITVVTDSKLSNILFNIATRAPRKAAQAAERMREAVTSSPLFPQFLQLANQQGFTDADNIARQLVFACAFNMSGGLSRFLLVSTAAISIQTQTRQKLQQEIDAWDPHQTKVHDLPYLDAVFHETMRLYPWPRFVHKRAKRDFLLPASDGKHYQIKQGELLMTLMPYAHRDPTVFKDDPLQFRPERFLESPDLRDKVFGFGWAKNQQHTYGCAGRLYAQQLWKEIVAHMFQQYQWQVTDASFDISHTLDVKPADVTFSKFKPRQTNTHISAKNQNNPCSIQSYHKTQKAY